jgi:hypothetical protein
MREVSRSWGILSGLRGQLSFWKELSAQALHVISKAFASFSGNGMRLGSGAGADSTAQRWTGIQVLLAMGTFEFHGDSPCF